jgi:tripartite-type tricarboxylate transporter receptor subunit TctC
MTKKAKMYLVLGAVLSIFNPNNILAGDYPTMPVTEYAGKYLGKPVVVVQKTGAAGSSGCLYAAQAKPDGYTLNMGWSAMTTLIIGEIRARRKPSFTMDDFIPLGRIVNSSPLFLVPYNSPWKNANEVFKAIKENPGKYKYASGGIFSTTHIPMMILEQKTGMKMKHVPFQGGGPAAVALVGGHVDFAAQMVGTSRAQIDANQIRPLAQFTTERLENYPDVPTIKELGYGDVHSSSWFGLQAPKGTPALIVERLRTVVKQVANDPGFAKILKESGENPSYADAEASKRQYHEEYETLYPMMIK